MKFLCLVIFTLSVYISFGQTINEEIQSGNKGNIFIETEYGRFIAIADIGPAYGIDGGYFILDNFALKFKTGVYTLGIDNTDFIYGLGAKYYLAGRVPMEINYTRFKDSYLKEFMVGYAVIRKTKFYLEPSISLVLGEIDSYIKPSVKMLFIL